MFHQMLSNLRDPATLGTSIAAAVMTCAWAGLAWSWLTGSADFEPEEHIPGDW